MEAIVDALVEVGGVTRLDDLAGGVLDKLRVGMGATGSLLYQYGPRGDMSLIGGRLFDAMAEYHPSLMETDPTQAIHRGFAPGPKVVPASALAGLQAFHESEAYRGFYRHAEVEHLVCLWLNQSAPGIPGMVGLLLTRNRWQAAFSTQELSLLERLLPAFVHAVSRSARGRQPPLAAAHALKRDYGLTGAEMKVLRLLGLGLSNRQIAQRRGVSLETVRSQVRHVLQKLGAGSRVKAALMLWSAEESW